MGPASTCRTAAVERAVLVPRTTKPSIPWRDGRFAPAVPPSLGQASASPNKKTAHEGGLVSWKPASLYAGTGSTRAISATVYPIPSAVVTVATPAQATRRNAFHPAAPKPIRRSTQYQALTLPWLSEPEFECLLVLFVAFALSIANHSITQWGWCQIAPSSCSDQLTGESCAGGQRGGLGSLPNSILERYADRYTRRLSPQTHHSRLTTFISLINR